MDHHYVLGFVFDMAMGHVLLIEKARPAWQVGLLNGVGGHVDEMEMSIEAMIRECKEESGLDIVHWRQFAVLNGKGVRAGHPLKSWTMDCFMAVTDKVMTASSKTDEAIRVIPLKAVSSQKCLPNLAWLIPMALSIGQDEVVSSFVIEEQYPSDRVVSS